MGYAVLKQPDGKLAVWSTVENDFIVYDSTPEEISEWWVAHQAEEARTEVGRWVKEAQERGSNSRMGRTFESALAARMECHGEPEDDQEFADWLRTMKGSQSP